MTDVPLAARIPHRAPMHWIDETEVLADGSVIARRKIVTGQPFVRGGALLPAALVEMLSQAAACGQAHAAGRTGKNILSGRLVAVRNLVLHGTVCAGETVRLSAKPQRTMGQLAMVFVEATVEGRVLAQGQLTFHVELG